MKRRLTIHAAGNQITEFAEGKRVRICNEIGTNALCILGTLQGLTPFANCYQSLDQVVHVDDHRLQGRLRAAGGVELE